jgi:hypothetical protein
MKNYRMGSSLERRFGNADKEMSGFGTYWSRGCGRGCEYVCLLHVPFSSAFTKVAMRHTPKEDMDTVIMETPHPCVKICAGSARTRFDVCAGWTSSGEVPVPLEGCVRMTLCMAFGVFAYDIHHC